jgi:hypothetical protein
VTQQNDTKSDVTGLSAINDVVKAELSQYYGLSFALTAMAKMLEAGKTIDVLYFLRRLLLDARRANWQV